MSGWRLALALVVALAAVVALGIVRGVAPGRDASNPPRPASLAPTAAATPRPAASGVPRDVFSFADEAAGRADDRARALPEPPHLEPGPRPSPGPRLVGIVRRGGKLVAALGLDGEVELAGAGESAAGVQVLAVDEDGVRIRRPDGSELTLLLE